MDGETKGNSNEIDPTELKKKIDNKLDGNETTLNNFDTRNGISKHGNKIKLTKINVSRKVTKKT